VRPCIARVALGPRFQCLLLPFEIAGDVAIVECVDEEALDIAGPAAQLVGFARALARQRRLSHHAVAEPDLRVAHRKIGIDRDRTLVQRQASDPAH